jgi:3-hydroxyisobutyrate dehydrogenase-like beta-hydroxyacid dehydrogenase
MKETVVAVLGTGRMGSALVRAFAAAGHSVVAWNRTPARAEPLRTVSDGGQHACDRCTRCIPPIEHCII